MCPKIFLPLLIAISIHSFAQDANNFYMNDLNDDHALMVEQEVFMDPFEAEENKSFNKPRPNVLLEPTSAIYPDFYKEVYQNLSYPAIAKEIGLEGDVQLEFTVDADGVIDDIRIISSSSKLFEQPVIEAVKNLPNNWIPATMAGLPVDSKSNIIVSFKLK